MTQTDGKRRSGRVSTERLHYFNDPLSVRQVSFYSDISTETNSTGGDATPTVQLESNPFLTAPAEAALFSTHPRNNHDAGMAELSKQMQLWTDEAVSRRAPSTASSAASPRTSCSQGSFAASLPSTPPLSRTADAVVQSVVAAEEYRGLVIKLATVPPTGTSTASLTSSSSSFASNFRSSPATSFTDAHNTTLVDLPVPPPPSLHPKPFTRVTIKKQEGSMRSVDQVSSYDAASFRSSEETEESNEWREKEGLVIDSCGPASDGPPRGPGATGPRQSARLQGLAVKAREWRARATRVRLRMRAWRPRRDQSGDEERASR